MSVMSLEGVQAIEEIDFNGKRVLIRADFSSSVDKKVAINKDKVHDALPTIKYVLNQGASAVIIMGHIGRPEGEIQPEYSLKPIAEELGKLLKKKVIFMEDCVGPEVEAACTAPKPGSVILLENLRFHMEEEGKIRKGNEDVYADAEKIELFRESLSKLGDVYINDAFSNSHRQHSSVMGVKIGVKAAGLLMKREMTSFSKLLDNPARPFVAIIGGAKFVDKVKLMLNLVDLVDEILVVGAVAFSFLKVLQDMSIGSTKVVEFTRSSSTLLTEKSSPDPSAYATSQVLKIRDKAKSMNVDILLPVDFIVAEDFRENSQTSIRTHTEGILTNTFGMDIGPESIKLFKDEILKAKSIFWNGPAGVYEMNTFSKGTRGIIDSVAKATKKGAISVVGGSDTAKALKKFKAEKKVTHVSTGGGACLELVEGKELPGIASLMS